MMLYGPLYTKYPTLGSRAREVTKKLLNCINARTTLMYKCPTWLPVRNIEVLFLGGFSLILSKFVYSIV